MRTPKSLSAGDGEPVSDRAQNADSTEARAEGLTSRILAHLAEAPWIHIRARVSLLTGSVLVLLTLFVPVAFDACGPNQTGLGFLRGAGVWPGMASLLQASLERGVYALGVALAAFTLILLLASLRRPARLHVPRLRWPGMISGVLSLFALADFFWFNASDLVDQFLVTRFGLDRPEALLPVVDALTACVILLGLRSRFLRHQRWIVWLSSAALAACVLGMAAGLFAEYHRPVLSTETVLALSISPGILYWVVPAGLWYRFGCASSAERHAQWHTVRPWIVLLYLPLVLFVAAIPVWGGDLRPLWGLIPYLGGLCLIFLGYLSLTHHPSDSKTQ
jgi:hypothetical protein